MTKKKGVDLLMRGIQVNYINKESHSVAFKRQKKKELNCL